MGTKTVPAKPSELIILAINNLEEKDGSSSHDIIKFITNEFQMKTEEVTPRVQEALKRAMTYGIISLKDGKYKLQDIPKTKQPDTSEPSATPLPSQEIARPEEENLRMTAMAKPKRRNAPKKVKKKKKAPIKAPVKSSLRQPKEIKTRKSTAKKICRRCQSKAVYL